MKEIRLRLKSTQDDIDVKTKKAIQLLGGKQYVQIAVLLRGREVAHQQEGIQLAENVVQALAPKHGTLLRAPEYDGKRILCTVAPN